MNKLFINCQISSFVFSLLQFYKCCSFSLDEDHYESDDDASTAEELDGESDADRLDDGDELVPTLGLPVLTLKCRKRGCRKYDHPFKCSSALITHEG